MIDVKWGESDAFETTQIPVTEGAARRSGVDAFPAEYLSDDVTIAEEWEVTPKTAARRTSLPSTIDVTVSTDDGNGCLIAMRHASGALTFHRPESIDTVRRSANAKASKSQHRFRCPVRMTPVQTGRRGIISRAVKVIVVEIRKQVIDRVTGFVLQKLAALWESRTWEKKGLERGWLRVTDETLRSGQLAPVDLRQLRTQGPLLLLIHGTFSNAQQAFGSLADSTFFEQVKSEYGDNIFAFNHFTVSETPEENARALLKGLPNAGAEFDVVTHSRGGLVLRNLVERSGFLGSSAGRFRLRRAVLVASPNEGTPLATPARWEETVGMLANLMEWFPENPFTTGVEFVSEAIVWIASHVAGDLPGLASMDMRGAQIAELQAPPNPPPDAYHALVANYHPDDSIWSKLLDLGVDSFFASANDIVVPSEGGWRTDEDVNHVSGDRIGCFGAGGNLDSAVQVHHGNFFSQPQAAKYLRDVLLNAATGLTPIDPRLRLPDRRLLRRRGEAAAASISGAPGLVAAMPEMRPDSTSIAETHAAILAEAGGIPESGSAFHLMVLPRHDSSDSAQLLATYYNARVVENLLLKGPQQNAGRRWRDIINQHKRIQDYVDGKGKQSDLRLLDEPELIKFGISLFETLFPGDVRRLYDVARSSYGGDRLPVILTSMIPWVADKPWEFAYDTSRRTFLATEEIHFLRNVLTAIPAEQVDAQKGPLRILVAVAQPVRTAQLSAQEEISVIQRGFAPLIESGKVQVTILPRATPRKLHSYVGTGRYDVVHFVGHGEFDEKQNRGYLLFENASGEPHRVDERSIREILCRRSIRLVFLNACDTGRAGGADFNRGTAQSLVAGGIPAVVANQYKVLDYSATEFAQHFYWCLANGMTIGESAREARISVGYSENRDAIDWAVPVVYSRDSRSRFCVKRTSEPVVTMPAVVLARRRGAADSQIHIGIWDVSYAFPQLEATIERLNSVQDRFQFEIAPLTVPLSSRVYVEGEEEPYLHADAVARTMAMKPGEMGLDYLACITNEPLACDHVSGADKDDSYLTTNIYTWSDDEGKVPVFLFSAADLDLTPSGTETARALTNSLVFCIAAQLGDVGAHERPPATCPLYYDAERNREQVVARQSFDTRCAELLKVQIPKEYDALVQMLGAF